MLLLDVNYTNNSKTLQPKGADGGDEMVAEVDGLAAGLPALVERACMSASERWRDGIRRVNRAPAILVGVWLLTLLVSLPLALRCAACSRSISAAASRPTRRRAA